MIRSKLLKKSGLEKLLSDPDALKKDIQKLTAQEKKAKAAAKDLYEAKSKTAFYEELLAKVSDAEKRLESIEEECTKVLHAQKETVLSLGEELQAAEKGLKSKDAALKKKAAELSMREKQLEVKTRSKRKECR
jgi:uncharacterized protein (DUF3084 family)